MASLSDMFENTDVLAAVVSETWFVKSDALDQITTEAKCSFGLGMIHKCRTGRQGGGVSIVFKSSRVAPLPFKYKSIKNEVVAACFKIDKISAPVLVIGAYLPPNMKKQEVERARRSIIDLINKAKSDYHGLGAIVAGDFNRHDMSEILNTFPDLIEADWRKGVRLDRVFMNLSAGTPFLCPPLTVTAPGSGACSDHKSLIVPMAIERKHAFTKITRPIRRLGQKQHQDFKREVKKVEWAKLLPSIEGRGVDHYLAAFHGELLRILEKVAPQRMITTKSTDKPWVTDSFLAEIKRRKRAFKIVGRGKGWKRLKARTRAIARKKKARFYNDAAETLSTPNSGQIHHRAIKKLRDSEAPPPFQLQDMKPGTPLPILLEELADYFSGISAQFAPLTPEDLPNTHSSPIPTITPQEVATRLASIKKPRSQVAIDVPASLITGIEEAIAAPLAMAFNAAISTGYWPSKWREEEVFLIPKTENPTSFDQLRNISGTSIFSKLLETFMLDRLNAEVVLKGTQYGGRKGVGTSHVLAGLHTSIAEGLDAPNSASCVLAIDFRKAFNRLQHRACLTALASKGASSETLQMVYSFLRGRSMRIKASNNWSTARALPGGSPQGTKCGGFLFSAVIDDIEDPHELFLEKYSCSELSLAESESDRESLGLTDLAARMLPPCEPPSSPIGGGRPVARRIHDTPTTPHWTRTQAETFLGLPGKGPPELWKYIDDFTAVETIDVRTGGRHLTESGETKKLHAEGLERLYLNVEANAKAIGMEVDEEKTKLVCVTAGHAQVEAFIRTPSGHIRSSSEVDILGMRFSAAPGYAANTQHMIKKYYSRAWSIRHLKRSGLSPAVLIKIYATYARPALEYAAPAFTGGLTVGQQVELERCQRLSLKTILGHNKNYESCLAVSGLPSLTSRRADLMLKFALKAYADPVFGPEWFPDRPSDQHNLRERRPIEQGTPRCERLRLSPLFIMRELLNEQDFLPGRPEVSQGVQRCEVSF